MILLITGLLCFQVQFTIEGPTFYNIAGLPHDLRPVSAAYKLTKSNGEEAPYLFAVDYTLKDGWVVARTINKSGTFFRFEIDPKNPILNQERNF